MVRWTKTCAAVALGACLMASSASAQSPAPLQNIYAGVSGGIATFFDQGSLQYDFLGYVIAGQVGYRMTPNIRLEGELAYEASSADADRGIFNNIGVDISVIRASASAYYDFDLVVMGGLVPYAGAGLGVANVEVDFASVFGKVDNTELSAHIEGGVSMKFGNNLDFVPAARWELTNDASNAQLRLGARYWF